MVKSFKEKIKHHFHEVLRIKKSPHSIALGFAIGTLIGILPTPGFGFLLGLLIVLVYEKVNKIALFVALIVWNPIIMVPIYYLSFKLGNIIFGSEPLMIYNVPILDKIYYFSRRYLVGNFILAATISIASYFIIKKNIAAYNQRAKSN